MQEFFKSGLNSGPMSTWKMVLVHPYSLAAPTGLIWLF